jgi:hypothetical protein
MLKHLHLRVFRHEVDSQFQSAFLDYYGGRAEFSDGFLSLEGWEEIAKVQVSPRVIYHSTTSDDANLMTPPES